MWASYFKVIADVICSLFLMFLLSPLFISLYVIILLNMGRPVIFRQERVGLNGTIFRIYKFRSMTNDVDKNGELLPDHLRLKGIGKIIRSLSLDELPQLMNVLKGDMSFVGPRPLLTEYIPLYSPDQFARHNVRPGITGWAQVNGRNGISWKQKFEFDVFYVNNLSFLFDLKILFLTMLKVFKREGISQTGHVTIEKFNGMN